MACLGGGYLLWGWLSGWEEEFAITADGIEQDQRLWSWNKIARLGGTVEGKRVKLFFYLRGNVTFYRNLATTPLLTRQEYDALIRELRTFLAERHPDVTFDLEPEVSSS